MMDPKELALDIYDRWYEAHPQSADASSGGVCHGCPVRDPRGCRKPFFGHGSPEKPIDVMLIGEAPGPAEIEDNDQPDSQWHDVEATKEYHERIYAAFEKDEMEDGDDNSPYLKYFTDELENTDAVDGVYFTNLLKCNKIDSDITTAWIPTDIDINTQDPDSDLRIQSNYSTSKLNETAKAMCIEYLKEELVALDPEVIVPFGGELMVQEVYDLFDEDVPDIYPRINNRDPVDDASTEIRNTQLQTTIVPTYHFSGKSINQNISNIEPIARRIDDDDTISEEHREMYWEIIIDMIVSELES